MQTGRADPINGIAPIWPLRKSRLIAFINRSRGLGQARTLRGHHLCGPTVRRFSRGDSLGRLSMISFAIKAEGQPRQECRDYSRKSKHRERPRDQKQNVCRGRSRLQSDMTISALCLEEDSVPCGFDVNPKITMPV